MGIVKKIKEYLAKASDSIKQRLNKLFKNFRKVDEDFLKQLLEALITSDVGFETSKKIIDQLREIAKEQNIKSENDLKNSIRAIMLNILKDEKVEVEKKFPRVILLIGVNGVGKTTSAAKLANFYKKSGKKVMLAAADTFRAAAVEQLNTWGTRIGVKVYSKESKDPASIVFDATKMLKDESCDILICDTAGRLHNQKNLMEELKKIKRTIEKHEIEYETLLIIDAGTGQNAISQIKSFKEITDVNGIFLTKVDGSSKGGVIFPIKHLFDINVKFVGTGETIEDIDEFDGEKFCYEII